MIKLPPASHFINGKFVESSGKYHDNIYPANGNIINQISYGDDALINQAIDSAQKAYKIWRNTSLIARAEILNRAAQIIKERNNDISIMETYDTGKARQETIAVDAISGSESLSYFAAQAMTLEGDFIAFSGENGTFGYSRREPLGICLGIGAWNYPFQMACWKSAPALACGNVMIFKPSELTPLSALELAKIYQEAGLPDGVFNVIQGDHNLGADLVAHHDIHKVSLTGEVNTGKKILSNTADNMKHVTLELGGKSPLIIFDDTDIDQAISVAMMANFYSTGQVCSNATRVFVHDNIIDDFCEKIIARTKKMIIGDPMDMQTQMGPLVNEKLFHKVASYYKLAFTEGDVLCGGDFPNIKGFEKGFWVSPTIIRCDNDNARIVNEEIFGPLMTILRFCDDNDVIDRANNTTYGLAAGVMTNDIKKAHHIVANLQAGTCYINNFNITPPQLSFGGYKHSGKGRENSKYALDAYSQIKSVYVEMDTVEHIY